MMVEENVRPVQADQKQLRVPEDGLLLFAFQQRAELPAEAVMCVCAWHNDRSFVRGLSACLPYRTGAVGVPSPDGYAD